ncbi:DedA family protein [bacterium]|nr:DedA family protein [bacterium]
MQVADILAQIGRFVVQLIDSLGYGGIAILMALSSAGIPIPSEVIMPSAGALVAQGKFQLWAVVLFGATGALCGSLALYLVGRYAGRRFLIRYGRYILLSERELTLAEKFFLKYGWLALFLGQMLPLIRCYIAFPAGVSKMKIWMLFIASFLGSLIWSFLLGFIGVRLGDKWEIIEPYFREFDIIILAVLLVLLIIAIIFRFKGRTALT